MTAYVVTTNQNIDEAGWRFLAPINGARTVATSINGFTWTTSGNVFPANTTWTGFAYGDELCVFIAANRSVSSTTAPELTGGAAVRATGLPTGSAWRGCAFGNGTFVTVCTSTTAAAYMRPRSNIDWTVSTLPSSDAWSLIAFGNNTFVTIAPSSTSSAYSTDNGATWNSSTLPAANTWTDLKYSNGTFVLVASGSSDVYTSMDGQSWTLRSGAMPSASAWNRLAWADTGGANGTWIALSNASQVAYSTNNGISWNASTMPASGAWIVSGGRAPWDGRQVFTALIPSTTTGAFSLDGITWTKTTITSAAYFDVAMVYPKIMSGDTLTINNGAVLTVNTDQKRALVGASAINIISGKLRISNTSTTTPIRFVTAKNTTAATLNKINASSGLAAVEVEGDYIEIGTATGVANQTLTSPYVYGDYIPIVEIETSAGSGVYEPWTNVTGASDFQTFKYIRNSIRGISGDTPGFIQGFNQSAVQYVNLTNCTVFPDSNVVVCDSTAGLVPGTWLTGRGLAATTVVQEILNSTTFTINLTVANTNSFTNIPMIGLTPICSQYATTLTFGDGIDGRIPPAGAKVRVQNILLTDITTPNFQITNYSSTNAGCHFTTPTGGTFSFNKCLLGESYSNYSQAGSVILSNVGGTYVPYVSECYQVSLNKVSFGLPPSNMMLNAAPVALAAGSVSGTTLTTPATNALIPGVLITGTAGLHACVISSITNNTTATISVPAHTNGATTISYYGIWVIREHRMTTSLTQSFGATFTTIAWPYISGATFTDIFLTFGGYPINGASSSPTLGSGVGAKFNTSYSNNITLDGLTVVSVGSYPKTRPYACAIGTSVSGNAQTYKNIKLYNVNNILTASAVSDITVSDVVQDIGVNQEGFGWVSGYRAITDPANKSFLNNDTKYWFKTRSYRSVDFSDSTNYIDGMTYCGIMYAPEKYKLMPQKMGAVPAWSTTIAPTIAYGNGVWVALNGAVSGNTVMVSDDNGATWTSYMMPAAASTTIWWNVIWCPTQNYFMAIQGGTVASTLVAYSTNGKDWSTVTTAPASAIWQSLAFDNSQSTNKWVGVSGGTAVSTAGTRASITNGSVVFAASTLASAQWIDVCSNNAGRYVAIAGGSAVGTATAYSTDGATWTAGGSNASSAWQSIAYGNGTFCCVSGTATNGPISCSSNGVAWTAGVAPTLPAGMAYNKVIYTGTAFVLLAGPPPLVTGNPLVDAATALKASQCYVVSTSNTATSITWGAIKYLPDYTHWISMTNNGNAVGVISTQTGKFAYTPDITVSTPTWTLTEGVFPTWNRITLQSQAQEYTTAALTIGTVATTMGSTTVTCASTATLYVGAIITLNTGNCIAAGAVYFGTAAIGSHTSAAIVTSITNSTTFEINKPAMKTASGMTLSIYKHAYQIFRSTTEGFTARDETTLLGTTLGVGSYFDDTFGVTANTPYHYVVRKLSGSGTTPTCSGTAGTSTITTTVVSIPNTITGFYYWNYSWDIEGKAGTDILTSMTFNFYVNGIVPGCIVTGAGIPPGTTVIDVIDFDNIRISANLATDEYARGNNRTYMGFSPAPGMYVYGSNVGMDCRVISIDSETSMTVSVPNTNTFTNQTLRFVAGYEMPEITSIPQAPVMVMNNALSAQTLATAPWVSPTVNVTNASGVNAPYDNFVGYNAAAPATTAALLVATAANGTVTQTVQTGVGTTHTFSVYARANLPTNASYIQMTLGLGSASSVNTLTNQWARYYVTFTTTAATTDAVITLPAMGTSIQVAHAMVTRTNGLTTTGTATTTYPIYSYPQQTLNPSNGLVGWDIDGGAGIETTLNTAAVGQIFAHLHLGSSPSFVISDVNQLFSTESPGANDPLISVGTSAANVSVSNCQPINHQLIHHGTMLLATTGATNVTVKDVTYTVNGTAAYLSVASPAYNIYIHNVDLINTRSYASTFYLDSVTTTNASSGIKYQNIRSNVGSRNSWAAQSLDTQYRGVVGADPYPLYNAVIWNLSTEPTYSGLPIVETAVYDAMFHEFTYGNQNKGCIDLRMIGSAKPNKPYTITSGTPSFTNDGNLALTNIGDQIIIEYPYFIKGLTGFSKRLPHIYSTDLGLSVVTSLGALIEYDLDKGTGYSNTWKQVNGVSGMINLSSETGISPSTGVKPKFRITARPALKYTAQVGQFVPGWIIQNDPVTPTATATVVDDETTTSTTTGTLVVSNIVGEWLPTNTIYSGTLNTTVTAATNATATMQTSSISGTTLTVGTVSAGTVAAGMVLTGTNVVAGTYIVSNISGSGSGSTWLISTTQTVATTTITGTNNLLTATSNDHMYVGASIVMVGTAFGGVTSGTTYYVSEVIGSTQFAISTSFNNALVATNVALSNASGSIPLAGIHSTITAVNTSFVWAPQPTSRLNSFRIFTENDTSTTYNYAFSSASLTLTGLKPNSEVRVYRTDNMTEIGGIENSGTAFTLTYDYYSDVNAYIVIQHLEYLSIYMENQTLGSDNIIIPIQQQKDRQYSNPV